MSGTTIDAVTELERLEAMSAAELDGYFPGFPAANAARAEEFARRVAGAGGPKLDYTEESLLPLWEWALGRLGEDALVDGLGAYLSEVALRNVPGARWVLWRDDVNSVDDNLPLVELYGREDRAENFLRNASNTLSLARRGVRGLEPDALLKVYRRWTKPPPRRLGE